MKKKKDLLIFFQPSPLTRIMIETEKGFIIFNVIERAWFVVDGISPSRRNIMFRFIFHFFTLVSVQKINILCFLYLCCSCARHEMPSFQMMCFLFFVCCCCSLFVRYRIVSKQPNFDVANGWTHRMTKIGYQKSYNSPKHPFRVLFFITRVAIIVIPYNWRTWTTFPFSVQVFTSISFTIFFVYIYISLVEEYAFRFFILLHNGEKHKKGNAWLSNRLSRLSNTKFLCEY